MQERGAHWTGGDVWGSAVREGMKLAGTEFSAGLQQKGGHLIGVGVGPQEKGGHLMGCQGWGRRRREDAGWGCQEGAAGEGRILDGCQARAWPQEKGGHWMGV
jgi:hypothetical protein